LKAWREFCGDGYDPAALLGALDAAASELGTPPQDQRSRAASPLAPTVGLIGLPEREAVLRSALGGQPQAAWARSDALFGSMRAKSCPDAFTEAAVILRRLFQLEGAPLDGGPDGFFGEDVHARWSMAILDHRMHWTAPEWRDLLWEYHDRVALGIVSGAPPPDPAALEALGRAVQDLVADVAAGPRRCNDRDLQGVNGLLKDGLFGYNVLSSGDGCVAAAQRLGAIAPPHPPDDEVARFARAGLLLWAPSAAEMVTRIERYIREIVLVALVRGWLTIADRSSPGRPAADDPGTDMFIALLYRAGGAGTQSFGADAVAKALGARVVGRERSS
jgi:hypothetical protein